MKTKTKNSDLEILKEKIDSEENIDKISGFIREVYNVSVKDAKDLVKSLDDKKLKTKLDAEKSLGKIGLCAETIAINKEYAKDIIKNLDLEKLTSKIDADDDIEMIGWCVGRISIANKEVAEDLIKSMDLEKLKTKIDAERGIEEICWCFANISVVDANAAESLVSVMKKKIEAEEDNMFLWNATEYLDEGDKKVVSKLINQLDLKKAKTPEVKNVIIELKKQYRNQKIQKMTYPCCDELKDPKTRKERYESATIDCYDDEEMLTAICMYAEEYLKFPFNAKIKDCGDTIFEITGLASDCNINTRVLCFAEAGSIKTKVPLSEIIPVKPSKRNKMIIEDYRDWNRYF